MRTSSWSALLPLVGLACALVPLSIPAQLPPAPVIRNPAPDFYAHVVAGGSGSWFSSQFLDNTLDQIDVSISNPDGFLALGLRLGFRNLVQVEFRRADGSHSLFNADITFEGGTFESTRTELSMDFNVDEQLLKINPLFFQKTPGAQERWRSFYLVLGKADVSYLDSDGDAFQFDGNGTVFGIEYGVVGRFASAALSVRRIGIDFGRARFPTRGGTVPTNFAGSLYVAEMSIAAGFGVSR
ncbi:MAG: hypothetical protein ACRENP_01300 [Longimicrobiales bacterium]